MKKIAILTSILAAFSLTVYAADTDLTGEAMCAKCELKTASACQMAIKVKGADGKEETILADNNDIAKAFHGKICKATVKVNAEGAVTKRTGKKTIALTKVEEAK